MAETSYPFEGNPVTLAEFRAWARQAFGSRVHTGLNVTASGQTVSISAGTATVDGVCYVNDGALTLNVPANTGSARRVYAALVLNPTGKTIRAQVITGPAGGGAPTWTQSATGVWQMPLAWVTQPANSTTVSGSVTSVANRQVAGGISTGGFTEQKNHTYTGEFWTPSDWVTTQAGERGLLLVHTNWCILPGGNNIAVGMGPTLNGSTFASGFTRAELRGNTDITLSLTFDESCLHVIQSTPGTQVRWKPAIVTEKNSNGGIEIHDMHYTAIGL